MSDHDNVTERREASGNIQLNNLSTTTCLFPANQSTSGAEVLGL